MAVTYVGAGSYAAGNNTAVTPGLPSGIQAGDLLVLITSIREYVSVSISSISGWTHFVTSANSTDTSVQVWCKLATGSDTAPTVTWTGGGTNDTTQAVILAFRGAYQNAVAPGDALSWATVGSVTVPPYYYLDTVLGATYPGAAYFIAGAWGNDYVMTQTAPTEYDSSGHIPADFNTGDIFFTQTSTLGSDATLLAAGFCMKYAIPSGSPSYLMIQPGGTSVAVSGAGVVLRVRPAGKVMPHTGSGGLKLGGAAVTQYVVGRRMVGAGGLKVGGTATSLIRHSQMPFTGGGGLKVGGFATSKIRYSRMPFAGGGGVKVGGSANARYHKPTKSYVGAGGLKVGGSAQTVYVHPTFYYVDPIAGNDANTGASWAQAWKSFAPVVANAASIAAGDVIKVAKSADWVATGSVMNNWYLQGSAYQSGSSRPGWTSPLDTYIFTGTPNLSMTRPVAGLHGTSGVTAGSGMDIRQDYPTTGEQNYALCVIDTGVLAAGTKLFHTAAVTLPTNLSTYGRLEMKVHCKQYGSNSTATEMPTWTLSLCSDTAATVSLLDLPVTLHDNPGMVWSYEGALPDGVQSIKMSSRTQGWACAVYVQQLIATQPYASNNYYGHFTAWMLDTIEGSSFSVTEGYTISSNSLAAYIMYSVLGKDSSQYNANRAIRARKITPMHRQKYTGFVTGYASYGLAPFDDVALTPALLATNSGHMACFDLSGLNGVLGTPIVIEGGYNTATDTVDGTTFTYNSWGGRYYYSGSYYCKSNVPLFSFHNSSNLLIKNIDGYSNLYGLFFAGPSDNHHIAFQNCTLIARQTHGYVSNYNFPYVQSRTVCMYQSTGTMSSILRDVSFKSCKGTIAPFGAWQWPIPAANLYNWTLEDSAVYPYGYGYSDNNTYMVPLPIIVKGSVNIYCIQGVASDQAQSATFLPPLVESSTGTLNVYRGGPVWVTYYKPVNEFDTTYTFPAMKFYDSWPRMYSCMDRIGETYNSGYGGRPASMVMPHLEIIRSTAQWSYDFSVGYQSYCSQRALVETSSSGILPPLRIEQATLTNVAYQASSFTMTLLAAANSAVQIKNLTYPAGWTNILPHGIPTGTSFEVIPDSGALYIYTSTSLTGQTWSTVNSTAFCPTIEGHVDFRNCTLTYVNPPHMTMHSEGVMRFKNCTISATNGTMFNGLPHGGSRGSTSQYNSRGLRRSAVILDGGSWVLGSAITTATNSTNELDYVYSSTDDNDDDSSLVAITGAGVHNSYSRDRILSKDTVNYVTGPFAWKNTLRRRAFTRWSCIHPLGSVPISSGHQVIISVYLRRSTTTSCVPALLMLPHGTAGFSVPADFDEKYAPCTAAANTWQNVTITYSSLRSGMVDLFISHAGDAGTSIWFDDFRVSEL